MPHTIHRSRFHLEDAGTWSSIVELTTFIHMLHTHHLTGSSQREEALSYCGPRKLRLVPLGLCPLSAVLPATPRLSLTQNKRWLPESTPTCCSNLLLFSLFKEKKCTFLFCVNLNSPVQSWGTVSFGSPCAALASLHQVRQYTSWFWKAEVWQVQGARVGAVTPGAPPCSLPVMHENIQGRRPITTVNISGPSSTPSNPKNMPRDFLKVPLITRGGRAGC